MATNTPNYDLTKPAAPEYYSVSVHNGNMDKLDEAIKNAEVTAQVNVGYYTGDGAASRTIILSRTPRFVLVLQMGLLTYFWRDTSDRGFGGGLAVTGSPAQANIEKKTVEITTNGFKVANVEVSGGESLRTNENGVIYNYIWG